MSSNDSSSTKPAINIAVFEACIIGLAAALGAVALKWGVGFIGSFRVHLANEWSWYLPIIGLAGGLVAGALIHLLAPSAAGSGIPQTKAALAGHPVKLDLMTAIVKLAACVTSLGSGLALGREGPTVQISAALASRFSGWLKTSPAHRIQLIAAGAGAGLAAAFNAPLAGVLFVLEELIKKMSGMAVGTTVVACFVAAVTSRLVGVHSLDINISELFSQATFSFADIPFLILLGFVTGVSAALFNKTLLAAMTFNRDLLKMPAYVSCSLAGLATGLIIMHLPDIYWNYAGLRVLLIQDGTASDVILIALISQFLLTILAYGLGAPGGLFAPSLTIGACLGHMVAVFEMQMINSGDMSTMAVVGMGAFFCAVARVPMTAVVIVFEMTQDFNVVLPLMVSCVVAYLVAERLDPGSIYDRLMVWSGFSLNEETEGGIMSKLKAKTFMTRKVTTIPHTATLQVARAVFEEYHHRGFPVVDDTHRLVGIVAQPDLRAAAKRELKPNTPIERIMTPKPISVAPDEPLTGVLFLMDKYKVSRLPVVEADRLVGIITRKDVVSAESQALGMRTTSGSRSYPVYQTRSPETGEGRMLVAVADPQGADDLVRSAALFAKARNYELECLHVLTVSQNQSLSTAKISTQASRDLMERCELMGKEAGIPVHTSIRVAHNVPEAIAETISDRKINVFLMRYVGSKRSRSDTLIQSILLRSTCSIILLGRLFHQSSRSRCIIPVAESLDPATPLDICLNFSAPEADVTLCQVVSARATGVNEESNGRLSSWKDMLKTRQTFSVSSSTIRANSPAAVLAKFTHLRENDMLILGLPRAYLAKAIHKGVFRKYLNRANNKCAIVITANEIATT